MSTAFKMEKLCNVAELNPKFKEKLESGSSVSFVPMTAVLAEMSTVTGEEKQYNEVSKGYTSFVDGDLLVAKITPCFENGKITQAKLKNRVGFGSTEFHVVRPVVGKLDARYLLYFLRQERIRIEGERKMTGSAGQRRVPANFLASLEIPLPPLPEQKRIADILDRAEALRAKRRAALVQLDELTQSIFFNMFGDPIFNTQEFMRIQLMNLCSSADDIKCGPFGTQLGKDEYTTEGVPLWGIKHVNALFKIPTQEFLEAKTAKRLIQYSIEPSDIVMTRKGTIGNCAVYPESYPPGIMHSDLLRLRINLQVCDPIFLSHQLHYSRDVERQLALISGGAVMPGINVTKLKSLEVLAPPLDLQKEFSHRIEAVEKLKAAHEASMRELDELFFSLQHRAFRGEL